MSRCDYCEYRNCVECEVGDRVSNDVVCNDFKLDFDTLSDREKKTIQNIVKTIQNIVLDIIDKYKTESEEV